MNQLVLPLRLADHAVFDSFFAAGNEVLVSTLIETAAAFSLVIEALLERKDFVASMALLIRWLNQADHVPLERADSSFHQLAEQFPPPGPERRHLREDLQQVVQRRRLVEGPPEIDRPEEYAILS